MRRCRLRGVALERFEHQLSVRFLVFGSMVALLCFLLFGDSVIVLLSGVFVFGGGRKHRVPKRMGFQQVNKNYTLEVYAATLAY